MTVVHLGTTLRGGAGIGLLRQHHALLANGADSRVIVCDADEGDATIAQAPAFPDSLATRLVRRFRLPLNGRVRLMQAVRACDEANKRQPTYELFSLPYSSRAPESHPWLAQADAINLHWVAGALDWPRFFRKINRPVVFTLHDQQPYFGGFHYSDDADRNPHLHDLESEIRTIKRRAIGTRRVYVVGNSHWNTGAARASGFFPPGSEFQTIYYPLDLSIYRPRPKSAARSALGLGEDRFVVGFASSELDNHRKGFNTLVEALRALPEPIQGCVRLLSFGRNPSRDLRSSVTLPWVHLGCLDSDVAKVAAYSAMDLFVIPSRAEAFGLTAIEALACGTPVIGSRVGGIPETLPDFGHEFLFAAGDAAALARLISSLSTAPARVQTLAAEGLLHVQRQHDPSQIAAAYQAVYHAALETQRSTGGS